MQSDLYLRHKINLGDEEACDQFIKKYYAALYQYCYLNTHDCYLAEDYVQETFLRFFSSMNTYHFIGKDKNYLYCIAGNLLKDYYKKKKEILVDNIPEEVEMISEQVDIKIDVEKAIDMLPEEYRQVVILYYFQNLKQMEIAKILKIKLSLVKYRISKAKIMLKKILEEGEDGAI